MDNVIIYDAIDGVLNECETVMGGVNNIQGTLDASNLISADSVVKSVQRGVSKGVFERTDSEANVTIPISSININKSVLILVDKGSEISGDRISDSDSTYVLSSNSITIVNDLVRNTKQYIISWQVIEFY